MKAARVNEVFLPGITFPPNVTPGTALEAALAERPWC